MSEANDYRNEAPEMCPKCDEELGGRYCCPPEPECMENPDECQGPVEYHSIDPGRTKGFPRCEFHWGKRLESRENSMERYENSDVAPGWYDPSYAAEEW